MALRRAGFEKIETNHMRKTVQRTKWHRILTSTVVAPSLNSPVVARS